MNKFTQWADSQNLSQYNRDTVAAMAWDAALTEAASISLNNRCKTENREVIDFELSTRGAVLALKTRQR